jgi:putative membrane protein
MSLSQQDQARIEAAVRECERTTGGQIVCVHARSAMVQRTALPVLLAALVALAVPWLLIVLTRLPVQTVLLLQALAFVGLLAVGTVPAIERALVPRAVRRLVAWRLAAEQFVVRDVSRTPDRSGILIFVAEAERYARIIADEGIARDVPTSQWRTAVDALVTHMRQDRPADGFIAAIAACTETLKRYRPIGVQGANVLPDRVHQI